MRELTHSVVEVLVPGLIHSVVEVPAMQVPTHSEVAELIRSAEPAQIHSGPNAIRLGFTDATALISTR